jgi:acetyl-CoA C-acetyltransferase
MTEAHDIVFVSGVRTAIGGFGGSLKDVAPTKLGAAVVREALKRAGVEGKEVESIVFGNVIQTEARDMHMARVSGLDGGLTIDTPALTVNRLCGSGLQAIVSAAQQIMTGDADIVVAGGAESMSRAPYIVQGQRWGQKMGDSKVVDNLLGALQDPFGAGHMGITAENLAVKWQVTRDAQDAFAVLSHQRAAKARDAGYFKDQIVAYEIETKKGKVAFDTDEHIRTDVSADSMRTLKPVFKKDGTVTAANASGINDGAAAVVMMNAKTAEKRGLKPMARLISYGVVGVEPSEMGIGPVPAVQKALARAGLKLSDMDVIESNEAFAAQALAVAQNLGFDPEKTNPNGGAIALGHPVGATGAIVTVKTLYELKRTGKRYGLMTLCIGGGQGIAAIIENLN